MQRHPRLPNEIATHHRMAAYDIIPPPRHQTQRLFTQTPRFRQQTTRVHPTTFHFHPTPHTTGPTCHTSGQYVGTCHTNFQGALPIGPTLTPAILPTQPMASLDTTGHNYSQPTLRVESSPAPIRISSPPCPLQLRCPSHVTSRDLSQHTHPYNKHNMVVSQNTRILPRALHPSLPMWDGIC